jgi:hypothetical protein
MPSIISTRLGGILDDLERYSETIPNDLLRQDLKSIIAEVVSYIARNISVNELESRLTVLSSVDVGNLKLLIEKAKAIAKNCSPINLQSTNINPAQLITQLEEFVSEIELKAPLLKAEDVVLYIDMVGSHILDNILSCAVASNKSVDGIKEMVRKKLSKVDEDVINVIWNRIVREFDEGRGLQPMVRDESVMSKEFLASDDVSRTREKIAEYVVELKPKLIVSMFGKNIFQYPVEVPGSLRIIASLDAELVLSIADWEIMLGKSISRLACIWDDVLYQDLKDLAGTLGLTKDGRLLNGPDYKEASKHISPGNTKQSYQLAFLELRKILRIADSIISGDSPVEKVLWQYKLGLEVMTPEIIEEIDKKRELLLQKELCKFLIEHSIYAVGTQFGRSQTDLSVEGTTDSYIVETKVYRKSDRLNERSLRKDVSQLQSYMDQYPRKIKGILAIYNMTEYLLETPRRWLHQRFWILPINLQYQPPSGRDKTMAVEESDDGLLIRVVLNETINCGKSKGDKETR